MTPVIPFSLPQDPDAHLEPVEDQELPKCVVEGCDEDSIDARHSLQGVTLRKITDDERIEQTTRGRDELYMCEAHWRDFDHVFACFVLDITECLPIVKCSSCEDHTSSFSSLCVKCGDELVKCNKQLKAYEKIASCPHIYSEGGCSESFECIMRNVCPILER